MMSKGLWSGTAVTWHHIVAYFKDQKGVSDDLGHNFGTVYAILKQLISELKETLTNGV